MSTYLLLEDHFVSNQLLQAGTLQSRADVGGVLPTNWQPTGSVDPQDLGGVNAFWSQGVQFPLLIPPPHTASPITYWAAVPGSPAMFQLTGLGAALAPKRFVGVTL